MLSIHWDAVVAEMRERRPAPKSPDQIWKLTETLVSIRDAERHIAHAHPLSGESQISQVREALARLHGYTIVDDLLTTAAQEACTIGFDRVLVSEVADSRWNFHYMHDDIETRLAADVVAQGPAAPPPLDGSIVESDTVSEIRPSLVFDVQDNPRVATPLVRIDRTESYCIAPLNIDGHVFGLIHGDCYHQRRVVTPDDQHALSIYAETLSHSLARITVLDRVSDLNDTMRNLTEDIVLFGRTSDSMIEQANLSRREYDVAELVATGDSNRQIARRLGISEATVKTHITHAFRNLGIASRSELLTLWLRHK
ncbi:LuxR C-terminal-related transcriptional regulator [Rhodococcus wratislaviensis]|uniref:LuxR C-terminal-related transcriptional regulator n=1 Tax=Rhodococcus wratislaviensis TaxID=44752 RepID=UPI0036673733